MAKSLFWYEQGLIKIAETRRIGIPEAALIALSNSVDHGRNEIIPDILATTIALYPGDTYTQGLKQIAQTDKLLLDATKTALDDAKSSGSTEHFAPISAACTWLIGRTVKS